MDKPKGKKEKQGSSLSDTAIEFAIKPGNYDLGSLESRAAARSLAEAKKKPAEMLRVVFVSPEGKEVDELLIEIPPS